MIRDEDVAETVTPQAINPLGNYAVQVSWEDGFNQVRPGRSLTRLSCCRGLQALCFSHTFGVIEAFWEDGCEGANMWQDLDQAFKRGTSNATPSDS